MPSHVFKHSVRVYWEDTDAGGIVYHSNYLAFMERARTEMLRELGFSQQAMKEDGGPLIVVSKMQLHYRRPAKLDDLLEVRTYIKSMRAVSIEFVQEIYRDDTLLVSAEVRCACVDSTKGTPTPFPENITSVFLPLMPSV